MKITIEFALARATGIIEGKPFVVSRKGSMTSIDIKDEDTFGGIVASKLLDFCGSVMDGISVIVDETDSLDTWKPLPESLQSEVYDAVI